MEGRDIIFRIKVVKIFEVIPTSNVDEVRHVVQVSGQLQASSV